MGVRDRADRAGGHKRRRIEEEWSDSDFDIYHNSANTALARVHGRWFGTRAAEPEEYVRLERGAWRLAAGAAVAALDEPARGQGSSEVRGLCLAELRAALSGAERLEPASLSRLFWHYQQHLAYARWAVDGAREHAHDLAAQLAAAYEELARVRARLAQAEPELLRLHARTDACERELCECRAAAAGWHRAGGWARAAGAAMLTQGGAPHRLLGAERRAAARARLAAARDGRFAAHAGCSALREGARHAARAGGLTAAAAAPRPRAGGGGPVCGVRGAAGEGGVGGTLVCDARVGGTARERAAGAGAERGLAFFSAAGTCARVAAPAALGASAVFCSSCVTRAQPQPSPQPPPPPPLPLPPAWDRCNGPTDHTGALGTHALALAPGGPLQPAAAPPMAPLPFPPFSNCAMDRLGQIPVVHAPPPIHAWAHRRRGASPAEAAALSSAADRAPPPRVPMPTLGCAESGGWLGACAQPGQSGPASHEPPAYRDAALPRPCARAERGDSMGWDDEDSDM
ncbi:hypothetical protein KFE25_006576 [Diacronema lutheri]|uniref:Uncharacterized protein n=1 Tax=Diacronema lutheri TaxID=2081491 RepID=A0A8J5X5T4_DIALT|nr:hypothetical protein KFE25_006576 [Diacronema lutheri]